MSSIALTSIQSNGGVVPQPKSYYARFTNGSVTPTNTNAIFPTNFTTDVNTIPAQSLNFGATGLLFTAPSSGCWMFSMQSYGIVSNNCYISAYANGGSLNHNNIFFNTNLSQVNMGHCGGTFISKGDTVTITAQGSNGVALNVFQLSIWQSLAV